MRLTSGECIVWSDRKSWPRPWFPRFGAIAVSGGLMPHPPRRLGAHWSVHPLATRPELTPVFLAPPLWMCEPAE